MPVPRKPPPLPNPYGFPTFRSEDGITFMSEVARDCYEVARKNLELVLAYQAEAADMVGRLKPELRGQALKEMAEFRKPFEESVARWLRVSVTLMQILPNGRIVRMDGN